MTLTEILAKIDQATEKYDTCKIGDTHTQSEILKEMSTALHFLISHKVDAHKAWLKAYYECKEKSATSKEKHADNTVPELYIIRHFMTSGYKIVDSLRTTISANKNG